eukprot:TRINITY_DN121527_c0_g1_i1.p1 TRINITY_DN121527_c0_g1~~TRINITY_DN121527_c0_g1_i1.p1  ORF type:complete len:96 (-),score=20.52 TRINITY_DN121527_c0_g1_i1:8-295(-)
MTVIVGFYQNGILYTSDPEMNSDNIKFNTNSNVDTDDGNVNVKDMDIVCKENDELFTYSFSFGDNGFQLNDKKEKLEKDSYQSVRVVRYENTFYR